MHAWKQRMWVLTVLGAIIGSGHAMADQPSQVTAPVAKVFVPQGFDDNDNVEVVVHGHFPSTCYKTGPASASLDEATGVITLDVKAYQYRGAMCAQVLVPFTQSIKVGTLASGTYRVEVLDRPTATIPALVVGQATTSGADDHFYAPVAQVSLEADASGQYVLNAEGEYPFFFVGCMVIRELRTYLSPGNTLVVLPISELVDGPECAPQAMSKKFSVSTPVGALAADEYLIHVRVLNGESVNRFVDFTR